MESIAPSCDWRDMTNFDNKNIDKKQQGADDMKANRMNKVNSNLKLKTD